MSAGLVWFRHDLRVANNPALHAACHNHQQVKAVYIDCPDQWREHHRSARQSAFIKQHLRALRHRLAKLSIKFTVIQGRHFHDVPKVLLHWINCHRIAAVYSNDDIGVNEGQRDHCVASKLPIPWHHYQASCIIEPGALLTNKGDMYQVFTPFRRAWLKHLEHTGYHISPTPYRRGKALACNTTQSTTDKAWPIGEQAAHRRLKRFCQHKLIDYESQRDLPAIAGTSCLSPYLAIGVLSPHQCLAAIEATLGHLPLNDGEPGFTWVNELIWREFYRHLMVAYPRLSKHRPFKLATEQLTWCNDATLFRRWCEGRTGYPIVDAAMRCLKQTGWLHNRLRMVVASFLTKDLHIDWRRGEAYFMSQLIDGDLPANNGGWQWASGTGADAAPYFRVFNPTTQGKRFDPQGIFIKRWVPELKKVPSSTIHTPHTWLAANNCRVSYPKPVVDHQLARQQAIAMFATIR